MLLFIIMLDLLISYTLSFCLIYNIKPICVFLWQLLNAYESSNFYLMSRKVNLKYTIANEIICNAWGAFRILPFWPFEIYGDS